MRKEMGILPPGGQNELRQPAERVSRHFVEIQKPIPIRAQIAYATLVVIWSASMKS
jgi:hypothetical protein